MDRIAHWALPRLRVALALFCVTAIVTIPWALANWGASLEGLLLLGLWLVAAAAVIPIARGRLQGGIFWLCLFAAMLATRALALVMVQGAAVAGDPGIYEQLARTLVAGEGLIFRDPLTGTDFVALYPPAYPLFLAGVGRAAGLGTTAIWASNVLLDIASLLVLAAIGRRLNAPAVGRAAAWLFAIWPAFVFATPFAQKEGLITLEVLTVVLVLLGVGQQHVPRWTDAALLGLAAAALALTQPGLALLPLIVGAALIPAIGSRTLLVLLLKAVPFILLLMMPWWVRNYMMLGSFVPLTTTGGLGLWVGNNSQATGNWMPMAPKYWAMPEIAMSAEAARDALNWIRQNPLDFVQLTFLKLFRAMGIEQFTLGRFGLMTPEPSPAVFALLFPLLQGSLIALLVATAAVGGRVRLQVLSPLILILLGCAVQIAVFSLPFEFGERHRYFLMPFLFGLLAAGFARSARAPAADIRSQPPLATGGPQPPDTMRAA